VLVNNVKIRKYSRHGLVDGLDAISHGKLVNNFLGRRVEVYFPSVVTLRLGQFHSAAILFAQMVEYVLVEASVLDMIRRDLFDEKEYISW
jgi:hypothetical protein